MIIDNILINFFDRGQGKTVLFLHGWGSSSEVFLPLAQALQRKYRVVGVDFPGFGGSEEPKTAWSVGDYVDFTAKFIKKLGVKDLYAIVGHSFGGRVMLKGVPTGQLDAPRLVFLDTAGIKPKLGLKQSLFKSIAKAGKVAFKLPGLRRLSNRARNKLYKVANASDFVAIDSEIMKETFKRVVSEDLRQSIGLIKRPSLVAWGANDEETPVSDLAEYRKNKNMSTHVIKDAGHYVFLDQPEKVAKIVREFL